MWTLVSPVPDIKVGLSTWSTALRMFWRRGSEQRRDSLYTAHDRVYSSKSSNRYACSLFSLTTESDLPSVPIVIFSILLSSLSSLFLMRHRCHSLTPKSLHKSFLTNIAFPYKRTLDPDANKLWFSTCHHKHSFSSQSFWAQTRMTEKYKLKSQYSKVFSVLFVDHRRPMSQRVQGAV